MRPPLPFRVLLRCYPAAFRNDYADEMWRIFQERRREAGPGAVVALRLWSAIVWDTLVTAAQTHADILRQDLRYAMRRFRGAPAFTATVLVVAGLGIGANTAAFSLTNHVLVRPLPFDDPSRLVALWQNETTRGYPQMELSPPNYRDWKGMSSSFENMAAYSTMSANLVGQGPPQRLDGATVTADLLPLLGARPAFGRLFTAEEDREGAPATVILSWGLWQAAFAGERDVLGRTIRLDDEPHLIVGVMPPDFSFPDRKTTFWRPIAFPARLFEDRSNNFLNVVARLQPGVTPAQARAELDVIGEQLERTYPDHNAGTRATVNLLSDELSEKSRVLVLALSGAAACVLLIACLNLANLLLVRALARRKELALRAALGAGRERLVRQLVTESLLLALGGGLLGLFLAWFLLPALTRLVPLALPIAATPEIDLLVLAVTAAATLFAAMVFGVVPALRACRDIESLREGSRSGVGRRRVRLRKVLVIVEVGASVLLLVCSGLLLRALWRVQDRDPGFRSDGVVTLRTWLPTPRYDKTADRVQFYDRVLDEAHALPGVSTAAYISFLPMTMGGGVLPVSIVGRPQAQNEMRRASLRFVTPGYFSTLRIPLRAGRDIARTDAADAPLVAVVSESFVRRYWPDTDPIGKRFEMPLAGERTVVGVVADVRVRGLENDSEPQVYLSYRQVPDATFPFHMPKDLVVRSSSGPAALVPALRAIVARSDPQQPVSHVRLLEDVLAEQTASRRLQLHVIGAFAALAFLLAAIGIYGLLSFAVSSRAQEIAVRMALGATQGSILAMVLREGFVLAVLGAALGLAASHVAGRSLEALLAGVAPTDVPTVAAALVIALVMTLAGSLVPAWRAARVDPATVMRAD